MAIHRLVSLQETHKLHRQNMQRSLSHRLEVAKINGNQALVAVLEHEQKELGL